MSLLGQLQADTDCQNFLQLERWFLAGEFAFVPRNMGMLGIFIYIHDELLHNMRRASFIGVSMGAMRPIADAQTLKCRRSTTRREATSA